MTFLNELIESLFTGFALFILATSFIHFKREERNELLINLTDSATLIIRFVAICYLAIWLVDLYTHYQSEEEYYVLLTRFTGPYWFGYWIFLISFGIFPQCLWVKRIKKIKAIRIVTALLLLFALNIEKVVIWVTALHRDYVPPNWQSAWTSLSYYGIIYDLFVNIIIFALSLSLVHYTKSKLAKISAK